MEYKTIVMTDGTQAAMEQRINRLAAQGWTISCIHQGVQGPTVFLNPVLIMEREARQATK